MNDETTRDAQSEDKKQEKVEISEQQSQTDTNTDNTSNYDATITGNKYSNIDAIGRDQINIVIQQVREKLRTPTPGPPPDPNSPVWEQITTLFTQTLTTDRERYYAITLSMFNGLKYPDFQDIYELVLQIMGAEKEDETQQTYRSIFQTDDEILVERVQAEIVRSQSGLEDIIKFKNDQYSVAIFDWMRRKHRKVLLKLLPALKEISEKHRYFQIRYLAAISVAEIGKLGFHRVRSQVLEPWGTSGKEYVRASVGYAVARLAEDEKCRVGVKEMLNDWGKSYWGGPKETTWFYQWTAASAYKQIGLLNTPWAKSWAYNGLKQIAGIDNLRLSMAVTHTIVALSLQGQLIDILGLLKEWIEQGSGGTERNQAPQTRCLVGILTFMIISDIHLDLDTEIKREAQELGIKVGELVELIQQAGTENNELKQMVVAVGIRAFEYDLVEQFYDLVADWLLYVADKPSLQDTVLDLIAEIFVYTKPRHRERTLNRMTKWEKRTRNETLSKMATLAKTRIKEKMLNPQATNQRIVFGNT